LKTQQHPEFIVVGHICQDLLPDSRLSLDGSISYAATTASRMGYHTGVVTSAGSDLNLSQALPDAQVVCQPASSTTLFENIYHNGTRTQFLHKRAQVLTCEQIPEHWRRAPMAYLGSIDQEIEASVFDCFDESVFIGVMPQGFFRRWDEQGRVSFTEWNPPPAVLRRINLLVISELDVPNPHRLARDWGQFIDIVVVTHAERGATVYYAEESCHYQARPAQQVDPTGAGDVFAAAFMIKMFEAKDPCQAASFANAVASFSVEGPGVTGIPLRQQVEAYLRTVK
jgi:sugar/nucleoside kinase (ribokinase family)